MSRPLGAVFVRWGTPRDPHPPALTLTTLVRRREKRKKERFSIYLDVTHTHTHTHTTLSHTTLSHTHTTLSHKQCRAHTALSHTQHCLAHTHLCRAQHCHKELCHKQLFHTHTHTLNSSYWKKMTWGVLGSFICVFFSYRESPNIHLLISRSEFFTDFSVAGMPPRPFLSPRTSMPQAIDHTMWGPPVISWFRFAPVTIVIRCYKYHKP